MRRICRVTQLASERRTSVRNALALRDPPAPGGRDECLMNLARPPSSRLTAAVAVRDNVRVRCEGGMAGRAAAALGSARRPKVARDLADVPTGGQQPQRTLVGRGLPVACRTLPQTASIGCARSVSSTGAGGVCWVLDASA